MASRHPRPVLSEYSGHRRLDSGKITLAIVLNFFSRNHCGADPENIRANEGGGAPFLA